MTCPHCKAPLLIEHAHCPYCGSENPYFKQHRADMDTFASEFEETKAHVRTSAARHSRMTVSITIISALIALNALFFFLHSQTWSMQRAYLSFVVNQNAATHMSTLDAYFAAGDYAGAVDYYDNNNLYYGDSFDEYRAVYYAAYYYADSVDSILYATIASESTYRTAETNAERLWSSLDSFYDHIIQEEYDDEARYSEKHRTTMDAMQAQLNVLLAYYLDLSDETIAALPTMTEAARAYAIEEGVLNVANAETEIDG